MTILPPSDELHWKSKLFPELTRLAWPIAISMLSYSLMTVVDTLFVGRLGASALAGVAFGGVIAFTTLCFGIGMLRAVKALVSQSVGAGQSNSTREYLSAGLAVAIGIGLLSGLAGYGCTGLIAYGSPTVASGALAAIYLEIRSWAAPAVLAAVALRETQYAIGDSRSPMKAALVANLANIPLNATLIFVLGLGVKGAALATVAAQLVELGILIHNTRRRSLRPGPLRRARCRQVLVTGWPMAIEFFLDVGAFSALTAIIARMGEVQLAAHQIAIQLSHFAFLPAIAVSEAASVLAGQAVGANEDSLVVRVARQAALLNLGYVGVCAIAILVFGSSMATWFTPEPAVQQAATQLLYVSAGLTFLFGIYVVPRAVLRGAGSERFSATVSVATAWAITLPVAFTLGIALNWGALGAWLGLYAEILAAMGILWWKLGGERWCPGAEAARQRLQSAAEAQTASTSTLTDRPLASDPVLDGTSASPVS